MNCWRDQEILKKSAAGIKNERKDWGDRLSPWEDNVRNLNTAFGEERRQAQSLQDENKFTTAVFFCEELSGNLIRYSHLAVPPAFTEVKEMKSQVTRHQFSALQLDKQRQPSTLLPFFFPGSTTYRSCTTTTICCTSCRSHFCRATWFFCAKNAQKKNWCNLNVIFFFFFAWSITAICVRVYLHEVTKHE